MSKSYVLTEVDEESNKNKGSKMKVTLEVDSEIATKFVSDEIEKLTDDERKVVIKEVLIESVKQMMKQDDPGNLLVRSNYNGTQLTSVGERLISDIDIESEIRELKTKMINDLIDHHREIVETAILNCIINQVTYSDGFRDAINDTVHRIVYEMRNSQ